MSKQQVQLKEKELEFRGSNGPWERDTTLPNYILGGEHNTDICKISDHCGYGDLRDTDLANAYLITAAPDLLAFAIDFIEKVESGRAKSTDSYNKAKIAVAKALNFTNG